MNEFKTILFVCDENSQYSLMAQALTNIFGKKKIKAYSAGLFPAEKINQKVLMAMEELDYEMMEYKPKSVTEVPAIKYDLLVEIGSKTDQIYYACKKISWDIAFKDNIKMWEMRMIRKQMEAKIKEMIICI
jgi:protein-tyrosine-phosphatase